MNECVNGWMQSQGHSHLALETISVPCQHLAHLQPSTPRSPGALLSWPEAAHARSWAAVCPDHLPGPGVSVKHSPSIGDSHRWLPGVSFVSVDHVSAQDLELGWALSRARGWAHSRCSVCRDRQVDGVSRGNPGLLAHLFLMRLGDV